MKLGLSHIVIYSLQPARFAKWLKDFFEQGEVEPGTRATELKNVPGLPSIRVRFAQSNSNLLFESCLSLQHEPELLEKLRRKKGVEAANQCGLFKIHDREKNLLGYIRLS